MSKGMPPFGKQRTHHVHVCEFDCSECRARQAFRDYLNTHESAKLDYETFKVRLASEFSEDRERYTEEKTDFIKAIVKKAIQHN